MPFAGALDNENFIAFNERFIILQSLLQAKNISYLLRSQASKSNIEMLLLAEGKTFPGELEAERIPQQPLKQYLFSLSS